MKSEDIISLAIQSFNGSSSQIVQFSKDVICNKDVTNDERVIVFRKNFELLDSKLKQSSAEAEYIYKFLETSQNGDEIDVVLQDCYLPLAKSFLLIDGTPEKALYYLELAYSLGISDNSEASQKNLLQMYSMVSASFKIRNNDNNRMFEVLNTMKQYEADLGVKNPRAEALISEYKDDSALGIGFFQAVNGEYGKIKKLKL